ncbi:MAG TPA: 4'-phosphopantetheinyl transferase superfamily protein [Alphaproteobacteria bacterium]|nr:4'-phosphopantetheinyl transferase superfamily protein [Alphaproteobacteria bacterium]
MTSEDGSTSPRLGPEQPFVRKLLPDFAPVVEGAVGAHMEALWPEEAAHIANAIDKRRREFSTGRIFAHRALDSLQEPPAPLLIASDRAPLWPSSVTGSITHTDRYCAVAVCRKTILTAIGIDVEEVPRFGLGLLSRILSRREIAAEIAERGPEEQKRNGGAMFSAKESLYKCLSAITTVRLDFRDCVVELDHENALLEAEILKPVGPFAPGRRFPGRYAFAGDLVATAISLPA